MPKSTSPHTKDDKWVVVADFGVDGEANVCVSFLQAHGVPALRLPVLQSTFAQFPERVRVLVPADRAEEAAELLRE